MKNLWTEEEAARKWCPLSRVVSPAYDGGNVTVNRGPESDADTRCIGSRCMAWREMSFFKNSKTGESPMPEGAYETGTAAECGYCGLAGHPDIELANRTQVATDG